MVKEIYINWYYGRVTMWKKRINENCVYVCKLLHVSNWTDWQVEDSKCSFISEVLRYFYSIVLSSVTYVCVFYVSFFFLQLKAAVLNSDLELLQEIVVQFDTDLPEFRWALQDGIAYKCVTIINQGCSDKIQGIFGYRKLYLYVYLPCNSCPVVFLLHTAVIS